MNKIYFSFAPIPWTRKPFTEEVGYISNEMVATGATQTTLMQIAEPPYSYSVTPAIFNGKRKKANWKSQQAIYFDFDNKNKEPDEIVRIDDVLEKFKKYGIVPNFYYYTFSNSETIPKFRIVLILDAPITNKKDCINILDGLKLCFQEADPACFEPSRIFHGGQKSFEITQEPVSLLKVIEVASIYNITNDHHKTRKVVSPWVSPYYNSNNTQAGTSSETEAENKRMYQNDFDWEKLKENCLIFKDFVDGVWLDHLIILGLATNMNRLRGGEKLFYDIIKKNNELGLTNYTENNLSTMRYAKSVDYNAENLCNFS
ncbi:MAG TPA: hypothetical protein VIK86_07435, partial [Candidatus Paceibacterota bacterium]